MPVYVVGLNHRSAPLALLERLAIDPERRPKALAMLLEREHVKEGAILSTCNRVEIYAEIDRFHDGGDAVRGFLTEFHGMRSHELSDYLYAHYEDRAVNHLFAVTAGIDSMVVGEVQILGQVREAFQAAQAERSVGPVLHALFTQALRVGRRARHETAIGQGLASTLSVSLQVAEGQLGTLAGRGVLIVGAGKMAKLASRSVRGAGARGLLSATRPEAHGAASPPSWAAARCRWRRSTRSWPPPTWWSPRPPRSRQRSRSPRSAAGSTGAVPAAHWSCWTSACPATSSPRSGSSQGWCSPTSTRCAPCSKPGTMAHGTRSSGCAC